MRKLDRKEEPALGYGESRASLNERSGHHHTTYRHSGRGGLFEADIILDSSGDFFAKNGDFSCSHLKTEQLN